MVEVAGVPGGPRLHPVLQARGYCEYLVDFARLVADRPDSVTGMAYLHNAANSALVKDLLAVPVSTTGQRALGHRRRGLRPDRLHLHPDRCSDPRAVGSARHTDFHARPGAA